MKPIDIMDALTDIPESSVSGAVPGRKKPLRKGLADVSGKAFSAFRHSRRPVRMAAGLALLLVICLFINSAFGVTGSLAVTAHAEAQAELPRTRSEMERLLEHYLFPGKGQTEYEVYQNNCRYASLLFSDFYGREISTFLAGADGENLLYSPVSTLLSLSMLAEISSGSTREQILDALGAESMDELRERAKEIWNCVYSGRRAARSSLWLRSDTDYDKEILKTLAESYYTDSFTGEMGSKSYENALHGWLEEATGGQLKDSTLKQSMDPEEVFSLLTTLTFEEKWSDKFSGSDNEDGVFHAPSGDRTLTFMKETDYSSTYYWGEHFGAVFKYLNDGSRFWMILPDEGITPEQLAEEEEFISFAAFLSSGMEWLGRTQDQWPDHAKKRVHLSLPKLELETDLSLKDGLSALGIDECFDPLKADFSGLTESPAFLSSASSSVHMTVDEDGVRAVSYIRMRGYGAAPPAGEELWFTLDRPFIILLVSQDSVPLFAGVVNEP